MPRPSAATSGLEQLLRSRLHQQVRKMRPEPKCSNLRLEPRLGAEAEAEPEPDQPELKRHTPEPEPEPELELELEPEPET